MSVLEVAAVIAVAVWLAVLTLVALLVLRQVGLLTAWIQQRTPVTEDGLDIGTEVPEPAIELLPKLGESLGYVLFLSGDCQPCREFVLDLGRSEEMRNILDAHPVAAAVTGRDAQADEVARLIPGWIEVIRNQEAVVITESFQAQSTPSVFEVERGRVTGRAVAGYGIGDFENLLQARANSDASTFAGPGRQEISVQHVKGATSGG